MIEESKKILVTGGAGFIGSEIVRQYITNTDVIVINVDSLTYAGNQESLRSVTDNKRYIFEKVNICDKDAVSRLFSQHKPNAVMHLAAETHVDRSIDAPSKFIKTNVEGTLLLLETARKYWHELDGDRKANFRFHHVSTDEVYGSLGKHGFFDENSAYDPSSPYSASKAASDHLVRSWYRTYGLPVVISNCSNNYGPYQFPEKLIPLMILRALEGKSLPIYGTGDNVRDWLYVVDHANALRLVLNEGIIGETYNIGGNNEVSNLKVVEAICAVLEESNIRSHDKPYKSLITFVDDRPGHDMRYAIDSSKINKELGWSPSVSFEAGLKTTIQWYSDNQEWCHRTGDKSSIQERLGLPGVGK